MYTGTNTNINVALEQWGKDLYALDYPDEGDASA